MNDIDYRIMEKLRLFQEIDNDINSNLNVNTKPSYKIDMKDMQHKNISDMKLKDKKGKNLNQDFVRQTHSDKNLYQFQNLKNKENEQIPQSFNNLYDFNYGISNEKSNSNKVQGLNNYQTRGQSQGDYIHNQAKSQNTQNLVRDNVNMKKAYGASSANTVNYGNESVISNISSDLFHSFVNYTTNSNTANTANTRHDYRDIRNEDKDKASKNQFSLGTNETSQINKSSTKAIKDGINKTPRKTPTKTQNKAVNKVNSTTSLNNNNNIIIDHYNKHNSSNTNTNPTTGMSKSPSGERLYNNAMLSKQKIEQKRKDYNTNIKQQMTPDISSKAKNIKRDPNKYHIRLYPAHKISTNTNNSKKVLNCNNYGNYYENMDQDEDIANFDNLYERNIYRKQFQKNHEKVFDYKPKIDKKSKKMAEKFGPALNRLLQKKKKASRSITPVKNKLSNTDPNMSFRSASNNSKISSKTRNERFNELYSKGLDFMKKRVKVTEEKKKKEAEEYTAYTYKPELRSRSRSKSQDRSAVKLEGKEIYERSKNWKKEVLHKKEKEREMILTKAKEQCSFKPEVLNNKLNDDEKFIKKNLNQIYQYVDRRQKSLSKQRSEEDYKKKIFTTGENYVMKPTIPKEFSLHCNSRLKNKTKLNNNNTNLINYINNLKNDKLLKDDENDENEQRDNYYDVNPNNSEYNNLLDDFSYRRNSKPDVDYNNKPDLTQENQMAFLDAVHNLHDKLVNLNI